MEIDNGSFLVRGIGSTQMVQGQTRLQDMVTGRAPTGEHTDWVMHEYTIEEAKLRRCQDVQDHYALNKVYKKSGLGPKNGEYYGAPFKVDWVDDELPQVSNNNEANNLRKQSNFIVPVGVQNDNPQVQCTWDDIEELLKQFVDSPAPMEPDINDYERGIYNTAGSWIVVLVNSEA